MSFESKKLLRKSPRKNTWGRKGFDRIRFGSISVLAVCGGRHKTNPQKINANEKVALAA